MEVILREHVDNLGKRGEIVKVADGYARNYLLPRKLALPATDANRKHVERERKIVEVREAQEKGQAEADGGQAGARSRSSIFAPCRRDRPAVRLRHGRRYRRLPQGKGLRGRSAQASSCQSRSRRIGDHDVPLKLHREVTVPLKVRVLKEGEESA